MRDDDLEHLSANYWITTVLCGLFLGIFLFMAATASAWFSSVLYCGSFTYLRLFFFTPFPTIATHEKGTAKYSTSLNENIQETEMHYFKKTLFFD